MTTDVLTETVVDEAEAIVRAEWMRLQHDDAMREHLSCAVCSEMPASLPHPVRGATLTATFDRSQPSPPIRRAEWPPRCGPQRRVCPTQRSPPQPCGGLVKQS
jgi:hypothetical protein